MEFELNVVDYIAKTFYDLIPRENSIKPLDGYTDRNYVFTNLKDDVKFVLKIVNESESIEGLSDIIDETIVKAYEYQSDCLIIPKPCKTSANKYSTMATLRSKSSSSGDERNVLCNVKLTEFYPSITLDQFINKCQELYNPRDLYTQLGRFCSELCRCNKSNYHLIEELEKKREQMNFAWSTLKADKNVIDLLAKEFYPDPKHERRLLLSKVLKEYGAAKPEINKLQKFVIHSDLNSANILIHEKHLKKKEKITKFCLVDFQDLQVGPHILELAILILYSILDQHTMDFEDALLKIPRWILEGFQAANSSIRIESRDTLLLITTLMKLRLAQSLLIGLRAHQCDPGNDYLLRTNVRGWYLLDLLVDDDESIFSNSKELLKRWID